MALSPHATTSEAAVGTFPQSICSSSRRLPASSVSPRPPPPPRSLRLDHAAAPSLSPATTMPAPDGLVASTIEHLEREPASVAADEAPLAALSPRDLQLVLIYFAQEGRDAYCALEVFDWLHRGEKELVSSSSGTCSGEGGSEPAQEGSTALPMATVSGEGPLATSPGRR